MVAAVVSLGLCVALAARIASDVRGRQRQTGELQALADRQTRAGDYEGAWNSLAQAAAVVDEGSYVARLAGRLGPDRAVLRETREDVAMEWLAHLPAQPAPDGRVSDVVDVVMPVAARGALSASGMRKADLLAHIGWGYFLKSRDGAAADPEPFYRQALDTDPANPFAHANWGHWIVWNRGHLDDASAHFSAALASGRQRAYVRRTQLSALRSAGTPDGDAEYLRAVTDMVRNREAVDQAVRRDLYAVYATAFGDDARFLRLADAVPPTEQIAAIRALFFDVDFDPSRAPLRDACIALLQEAAGDRAEALRSWRSLLVALPPDAGGPIVDHARAAVARLASSASRWDPRPVPA